MMHSTMGRWRKMEDSSQFLSYRDQRQNFCPLIPYRGASQGEEGEEGVSGGGEREREREGE